MVDCQGKPERQTKEYQATWETTSYSSTGYVRKSGQRMVVSDRGWRRVCYISRRSCGIRDDNDIQNHCWKVRPLLRLSVGTQGRGYHRRRRVEGINTGNRSCYIIVDNRKDLPWDSPDLWIFDRVGTLQLKHRREDLVRPPSDSHGVLAGKVYQLRLGSDAHRQESLQQSIGKPCGRKPPANRSHQQQDGPSTRCSRQSCGHIRITQSSRRRCWL